MFLSYCIDQNYFTIDALNQRISYNDFKDSKPSLINYCNRELKIKQSADQMLNLSREFPMLVSDKIPLDDYYYYAFLLLLKICSILLLLPWILYPIYVYS